MESPQPENWRKLPPHSCPYPWKGGCRPASSGLLHLHTLCPPASSSAWRALGVLRGEGLIKGSNKIIILSRMKYLYLPPKKKKKSQQSHWDRERAGWGLHPYTHSRTWRWVIPISFQASPPHTPSGWKEMLVKFIYKKFRPQHRGGAQSHLPGASSTLIFFICSLTKKKKKEVTNV